MTGFKRVHVAWIAAACVLLGGCAHVKQQMSRPTAGEDLELLRRDLDILPPFPAPARGDGSLWTDVGPGAALVRDTRAFRVNDLVTIALNEQSSGSNSSKTDLSRSSDADFGAAVALGLEQANPTPGRFSLNQVLSTESSSNFTGDGSTGRSNRLQGFITARVMQTLPNGDLVIAGQKTVVINRERQVLTLVGTVRAVDVNAANRVPSNAVGNLVVRLWGQGEIDATVRQGWFMRMLHRLWPF